MSLQPASLGRVWLGPQTARDTAATTFYGYQGNLLGLSPSQMLRSLGPLVGGKLIPGGSVKTGVWSGGALVMPPALDDYIGWLLYSFAGSVSSVNPDTGVYAHYFPAGADETAPEKYLTARRTVPGSSVLYEQMSDLKPYRLLFGLTPGEFATLRAEFVGRKPTNPDGSSWVFDAKDPEESCPITCNGVFRMAGLPAETTSGVVLDLTNIVPDLRRVMVGGSPYPYDFPVLNRAISVQFGFLWEDPTLYQALYYDSGEWEPLVYSSSYEVTVESAGVITGTTPYSLTFWAASVDWQAQPLALRGGDLVEFGMVGTVKPAVSGHDWYLKLVNGTGPTYNWPEI